MPFLVYVCVCLIYYTHLCASVLSGLGDGKHTKYCYIIRGTTAHVTVICIIQVTMDNFSLKKIMLN